MKTLLDVADAEHIIDATSQETARRFGLGLPQPFTSAESRRRVAAFRFRSFFRIERFRGAGEAGVRGARLFDGSLLVFAFLEASRTSGERGDLPRWGKEGVLNGDWAISAKFAGASVKQRGKTALFRTLSTRRGSSQIALFGYNIGVSERFPPLGRRSGPSPFCVRRSVVEETRPRAKSSSIF